MAAQDAELKLRVSLDLAFFKQQLVNLGTVAAGQPMPINVKFDRQSVQNELNALGANIRRRNYRLEIQTNLTAEVAKAKELANLLRDMPRGNVATGRVGTTQAGFAQSRFKQVDANEIKKLYKVAADIGLVAFDQSIANNKEKIAKSLSQVGKDSVEGLLNGLKSGDAQLAAAAQKLGNGLIRNVKDVLGIASPSHEFEEIGRNVGKGFEKGVLSSMDAAFNALERKMQQRTKLLDAFARGIFNMLGMDAASMRQQRLPPAINWPAQVPSRSFSGPSSTGRALPPGASPLGLPGTSFGQQKYLPTALGEELKGILRGAANAFVDTLKSQIRATRILDLGRTTQPALTGSRLAGLLPRATGRTPSPYSTGRIGGETQTELFARREREARMRSALREMDVMGGSAMVPYAAGGAGGGGGGGMPPRPPSGGGKMGGMGSFGRALGGINLPGTGVVREIGSEFAMATKQVLLFGTAYKALAFATSFPAQVGQAVGALQSFNNTLKAISPTAAEAKASNQFILDIVDRYNVPLQSARDGFTKLYASMAPAGFKGDEIRALFTGVSQAAATFGMSADKVDRVNYAFAQMASKGQVMSEELKGQLGDVLPGAMGIFAEAAGLEGPDAIEKFSKALEDGAYKGDAMRQLLKNVTVVLQKEFGPGAEGAARTFQGVINRMQNSTKLLYEAFEPVAVGFLNSVVVPLTSGIKTITDGFNAFFTGAQAKTAGGLAFAQELERLKPALEGIRVNIAALAPSFQLFGGFLLNAAKTLTAIAGNPITGFLLQVYTNILLVNTAFNLLGGRILLSLIASIITTIARIVAMTVTMNALGVASTRAGTSIAGTKLQMMLLQSSAAGALGPVNLLLASLLRMAGIGAIAIGITIIVNGLTELRDAEARIARLRGERDPVGPAGPRPIMTASRRYTGAAREKVVADQQKQLEFVAQLRKELKDLQATQTQAGGALSQTAVGGLTNTLSGFKQENTTAKITELQLRIRNAEEVLNLSPTAFKTQAQIDKARVSATVATVEGGDGKGSAADAERLANQQQQDAIDAANRQNALDKARFEGLAALSDQAFQHAINLIDARNNYELAGLDSIASRQEKFQQDLEKIELDRIDTVRKATQKAAEAAIDFAAARNTAAAAGGGTGLLQGSTGISSGPHFDVRRADGGVITEAEARALFSEDVRRQLTMTSGYGPRRAPAPGASTFHKGIDLAGPANTPLSLAPGYSLMGVGQEGGLGYAANVQGPQGQSYKVGHLQKPGAGYTMQRREDKAGGELEVERLQQSNALQMAGLTLTNATTEALEKRKALIAANINSIFPVAEQRLENDLMKIRNDLQLKGMPQEYIDYQEQSYKASYEMSEAIKKNEEDTKKYQQTVDSLQEKKAKGIALTDGETSALDFYTEAIVQNQKALGDLTKQQIEYNIAALEGAIAAMKNADALKAQQETMELIKSSVESASSSYKGFMKEVITGGDPSEALKKFQEAITDQVLTIFLDFAMKPVEDFFKQQLSGIFGVPTEEKARKEAMTALEAKLEQQRELQANIDKNVEAIANGGPSGAQSQSLSDAFSAPAGMDAASVFKVGNLSGGIFDTIAQQMDGATESFDSFSSYMSRFVDSTITSSEQFGSWSESFATTFSGTLEQATTAASEVLSQATSNANEAISQASTEADAASRTWQENLGKTVSAIGIAAGAIMGIAAGISQIKEGGTSGVLGGIGSILLSLGGAIGGFGSLFKGGGGGGALPAGGWLGRKAMGGPVGVNTPYIVGEQGPELFVPFQGGRVIANNDLGAAMQALTDLQMPFSGNEQLSSMVTPFAGLDRQDGSSMVAPFMIGNEQLSSMVTPFAGLDGQDGSSMVAPFMIGNEQLSSMVAPFAGLDRQDGSSMVAPFAGLDGQDGSSMVAPFAGLDGQDGSSMVAPFMIGSEQPSLTVPFKRASSGSLTAGSFENESVIRFETTMINGMEFVTKDEARKIGQTAAARGAELAQRRIKNSPQVRRSIGVGG